MGDDTRPARAADMSDPERNPQFLRFRRRETVKDTVADTDKGGALGKGGSEARRRAEEEWARLMGGVR